MSNLQDNQISSTTKEHMHKKEYSLIDRKYCIECQDFEDVLNHSTINCPEIICKNCLAHNLKIKGHNATICTRTVLYRPEEIKPEEITKIQTKLMKQAFDSVKQELYERFGAEETSPPETIEETPPNV